jgi:hypothetical protein
MYPIRLGNVFLFRNKRVGVHGATGIPKSLCTYSDSCSSLMLLCFAAVPETDVEELKSRECRNDTGRDKVCISSHDFNPRNVDAMGYIAWEEPVFWKLSTEP